MNHKSITILGVDPGSARIGYGLIEKTGAQLTLRTTGVIEIKEKESGAQLLLLARAYTKLLKKYKPDVIGIEKLFFTNNIKTGIKVAQSRGLLIYLSLIHLQSFKIKNSKFEISLTEFTPQQIKQAVTNYGGADKKAVARMVSLLLKTPHLKELDDATDALAIALCAANYIPQNPDTKPRF